MSSAQVSAIFIAVALVIFCFFMAGIFLGDKAGQTQLCSEQFKGEMHDGKCMFVTRQEITK